MLVCRDSVQAALSLLIFDYLRGLVDGRGDADGTRQGPIGYAQACAYSRPPYNTLNTK